MPVLSLLLIRWLAVGAAFLAFGGFCAYRMHAHDQIALRALQSDFDVFKGGVAALGKAAQERAKATDAANLKRKQDADAANEKAKMDMAGLYSAYQRLRDQRGPSGSILSRPAAGTGSPATVSFDRAAFDRAISDFDAGAVGLLKQGDEAIGALNDARAWAKK